MATVPVKFYVKKNVSGNCNGVTQPNHIELWATDDSARRYQGDTDATGYKRFPGVETNPYNAYTQTAAPCATCRQLVNITTYNQTVTLCNTCAAAKAGDEGAACVAAASVAEPPAAVIVEIVLVDNKGEYAKVPQYVTVLEEEAAPKLSVLYSYLSDTDPTNTHEGYLIAELRAGGTHEVRVMGFPARVLQEGSEARFGQGNAIDLRRVAPGAGIKITVRSSHLFDPTVW